MENIKNLLENMTFFVKNNIIELILVLSVVFFSITICDWQLSRKHRSQANNSTNKNISVKN